MAPCVYLNWHVGIGAEMEEVKPPEAHPATCVRICACDRVCLHRLRCHADVHFCPGPARRCLTSVWVSVWTNELQLHRRPVELQTVSVSGADAVVQAVEEGLSHFVGECQTALAGPRPLMWCIGSSVSQVIISQQAWHLLLPLLSPLLPLHSAASISPDNKVHVMGRTVSGTRRLPGCFSSFQGIYCNNHVIIFQTRNRQTDDSLCHE